MYQLLPPNRHVHRDVMTYIRYYVPLIKSQRVLGTGTGTGTDPAVIGV